MKIATWNVNGIRARQAQVQEWIDREKPDVVCLQEIKASIDQLPVWLCEIEGYWCYWHGSKGYSGVGLHVSRGIAPERPVFEHPAFDYENRIVLVRLPAATIASVYVPNGGKDFPAKMQFLAALEQFAADQRNAGPLIICGDINIARTDMDVHPKERKPRAIGQLPEERAQLERILEAGGLVDVGRALAPGDYDFFCTIHASTPASITAPATIFWNRSTSIAPSSSARRRREAGVCCIRAGKPARKPTRVNSSHHTATLMKDQGTAAALSALVERTRLPVDYDVEIEERLAPAVEAAAYFVVAEALTNVAKYAHASQASIRVRRAGDELEVEVEDVSDRLGALALQGPTSRSVLEACVDGADIAALKYFRVTPARIGGVPVSISRTGYTGDLGYEVWMPWNRALDIWDALYTTGRQFDLHATGMLALDVARVEAGRLTMDMEPVRVGEAIDDERRHPVDHLRLRRFGAGEIVVREQVEPVGGTDVPHHRIRLHAAEHVVHRPCEPARERLRDQLFALALAVHVGCFVKVDPKIVGALEHPDGLLVFHLLAPPVKPNRPRAEPYLAYPDAALAKCPVLHAAIASASLISDAT